ncbi:MAG TPA: MFS transporter [Steroidobacteraceae bacterium]|nr:MFS transporter [Steroidobacteraceae bacterium]
MTPSTPPQAPARAPSLLFLFVVSMIDVLGFGVLIPLVPYIAQRFGASATVTTAILGSYSLCQLLAAPVWGRLSDRYGRRPILMSSLSGACLSYLILGFANGLWMVLASRMLAGLMAGNLAAAFAYASDVSTPATRAKSMGMVGAAIGIGFMLGMPIGGMLAGNQAQTADFLAPALASAALSLFALSLVKFGLPESRRGRQPTAAASAVRQGPLTLLRQRPGLLLIASAALLVTTAQGILESIFALWALHRFGAGPRTVGFALFGAAFVAVLMQGGLVRVLAPRIGERRLAQGGVAFYVAGLLVVALAANSLLAAALGLLLCGAGMGAFSPSASALASRQSHGDNRGAVMGTYQSATSLARVIGPFVAGPVYAFWGTNSPFIAAACITAPAALLIWRAADSATDDEPNSVPE